MDSFKKMRPLGKWLWEMIPDDRKLAVEAKLWNESHQFSMGEYDATIEVISGELRGRMQHRKNHYPHLAEDALTIPMPETTVNRLRGQKRLSLRDIIGCHGIPDITITSINAIDGMWWLKFERSTAIRR